MMNSRPGSMTPYLTNMSKMTKTNPEIDSSVPAEFKKAMKVKKKLHGISNLHTFLQNCKPWH